jgi:tetratricopeptide (TPR) repeat protein
LPRRRWHWNPTTTRAYRVLAQIKLYKKRFDLALAQVDRALEINPSDADNYAYRGSILVWAGNAAESPCLPTGNGRPTK